MPCVKSLGQAGYYKLLLKSTPPVVLQRLRHPAFRRVTEDHSFPAIRLSEWYLTYPPDYPGSLLPLVSSDRSLTSLSLSAASCLLSLSS